MNDKFFLDTNIFVYSFDRRDHPKQKIAERLIEDALRDRRGMISTQVIQEFFNLATRKFEKKMGIVECQEYLSKVFTPLCEIFPDLALYTSTLELHRETGYSFYDSLIIAAALRGECDILYSEDLQERQKIRTVRVINPFS